MGKYVHRLSDIDLTEMTATCSNCGRVELSSDKDRPHCGIARREHNQNRSKRTRSPKKRVSGLSDTEYQAKYDAQSGKCAICGVQKETLCSDHEHKGNKIRDLLCRKCNIGLGMFDENTDWIRSAADYLDKWNGDK